MRSVISLKLHLSSLCQYSLHQLSYIWRVMVTVEKSVGSSLLLFSMVRDTSARLAGLRFTVPLKMMFSIFSERSIRVLCSPNTHRIASTTFDLPHPLGPTMAVTPSL